MKSLILILTFTLFLAACGGEVADPPYEPPAEFDCKYVDSHSFQEVVGRRFQSKAETVKWLVEQVGIANSPIEYRAYRYDRPKYEGASVTWEDKSFTGLLELRDGTPYSMAPWWNPEVGPSLAQVIDCIGKPDAYDARYTPMEYGGAVVGVRLYYPKQGTIVEFWRPSTSGMSLQKRIPVFKDGQNTANTPTRVFFYKSSGSLEELLVTRFTSIDPWFDYRSEVKWILDHTARWPEDMNKFVVLNR